MAKQRLAVRPSSISLSIRRTSSKVRGYTSHKCDEVLHCLRRPWAAAAPTVAAIFGDPPTTWAAAVSWAAATTWTATIPWAPATVRTRVLRPVGCAFRFLRPPLQRQVRQDVELSGYLRQHRDRRDVQLCISLQQAADVRPNSGALPQTSHSSQFRSVGAANLESP